MEGNSADIFLSTVSPGVFVIKVKLNVYYFWRYKTAVLGASDKLLVRYKVRLPFLEGKYQLLNSWNKILFPTIFYHMNFQIPHPNRSVILARTNIPLKGHKTM